MGLPTLLVFPLFLFFSVLSFSDAQANTDGSAISFTLCDGFAGEVNFRINVRAKDKQGSKGTKLSARFSETTKSTFLEGKIDHVKHVRVISDQNICFEALVVDTTIIIDQPTNLKDSCLETNEDELPCKELRSRLKPVFICPEALTKFLKNKGVIEEEPSEKPGPRDFETPTYDITNDMAQASLTIAEGLSDEFRKVVKHGINNFNSVKHAKFNDIGRKLGSFKTFFGALGPAFSIFSGITSIITTFLTPNPFDEMVKYLSKEFDEVHRRLSNVQSDIKELKHVVQGENSLNRMAPALRAIRYSFRRYQEMVRSLSKNPVCGSKNLLKRSKVNKFMNQYKKDKVEDSLRDLYEVDFGGVVEASSLLTSFMRAYCGSQPSKVQQFMQDISFYAYAGSQAHFAYKNLKCLKRGKRKNCDENKEAKNEWLNRLYKFMKKANALKEAAADPTKGLHLEMREDLDKLISDELKVYSENPLEAPKAFPGLLDKVYDFVIKRLYDRNDWPEACIVNVNDDSVVIIEVAQLLEDVLVYGSDFKPWNLQYKHTGFGLENRRFKIKNVSRGNRKNLVTSKWKLTDFDLWRCSLEHKYHECSVTTIWAPFIDNDRVLYFLFNPTSYLKFNDPKPGNVNNVIFRTTPNVIINMFPITAFYTDDKEYLKENAGFDLKVEILCLDFKKFDRKNQRYNHFYCRAPSGTDPNREKSEREQYAAVIAE